MTKLRKKLQDIVLYQGIKELKEFFNSSYRINNYINYALKEVCKWSDLVDKWTIYLYNEYKHKITDETIIKCLTSLSYRHKFQNFKYYLIISINRGIDIRDIGTPINYALKYGPPYLLKYIELYKYLKNNNKYISNYKNTLMLG